MGANASQSNALQGVVPARGSDTYLADPGSKGVLRQAFVFIAGSSADADAAADGLKKKAFKRRWRGHPGAKGDLVGVKADLANWKNRLVPYLRKQVKRAVAWVKYLDKPGSQLRKAEAVQTLKELFQRNDADVKIVYYTGHGTSEGNWVFETATAGVEEFITYEEVMNLFQTHSRNGARLSLVVDCCHSGVWVNKAQKAKSAANVYASCRANEDSSEDEYGGYFVKDWVDAILADKCKRFIFHKAYANGEQHPQSWAYGERRGL